MLEEERGYEVRAAGGVVWRTAVSGVEVCLVHRPRYDDWSLPKGKLDPGEHPLVAAVREVAEETDVRAAPQVRLPSVRYSLRDGTPKVVDFWSMRAVGTGGFQPATEVDEVCWFPLEVAGRRLSYPQDAGVLTAFTQLPLVTGVLAVVRHGQAGARGTWTGPDTARPLDEVGRAQAAALAPLVASLRPERLLSAAAQRCVQTLVPVADRLDLPIEICSDFAEPEPGQNPDERALAAAARLTEMALAGERTVVCSQGKVIPELLNRLSDAGAPLRTSAGSPDDHVTAKGSGWLLAFAGDRLVARDRLTPGTAWSPGTA